MSPRTRQEAQASKPHYVYRCYDANDRLLYIGCTRDVEQRMGVHRSAWSNPASAFLNLHMARYEAEEFPNKAEGRAAERAAIEAEAPLLNAHYNNGRGVPRTPAALDAEARATPPPSPLVGGFREAMDDLFGEA